MKFIHYLYITPLALLAACSSDDKIDAAPDTGNGPIQLSAGIVEGGQRAVTRTGAEDNHARHLTLTTNTILALQVSGTWTGHSPEAVIKATTATVGDVAENTDSKHNNVTCSPVLYWDDYGTADPDNASTGRTTGLTIYGAAINGKTTVPATVPTTAGWTIAWTLAADQTTTDNTPADKDLLISNNVKAGTGDGTYKFADRASGKLLEFTHALSKITVNLKAGAGFNDAFSSTTVTLTSNLANQTTTAEWAYTSGTVDVTTGTVSSQANNVAVTTNQLSTATTGYTVTKEALVMPGSQFTADNANIIRINADGNIYYVTAAKIRAALIAENSSNTTCITEAGKNYIINVTVNKTAIDDITATVTDWSTVNAAEVSPVINVSTSHGTTSGTNFNRNEFSFYRSSTGINTGYSADPSSLLVGSYYAEEAALSRTDESSAWTMSPQLYWPTHNTHYQFRGVWPKTGTGTGEQTYPRVETATHNSVDYQVIKVQNVAYAVNTFPSDLQIGRPDVADANCTNTESGHTTTNLLTGGICATEGNINLAFEYMMSQVEVNLSTSTGSDAVTLTNAVVEVENIYSTADVTLGSREVLTTNYSTGSYTLDKVGSDASHCWSAIVPQTLTYGSAQATTNVRFKITITNSDNSTDVYYCDVNPILVSGSTTEKVAPNGKWESGVHYVYNLKLTKTAVNVTATLAEWTTVTANPDVWF